VKKAVTIISIFGAIVIILDSLNVGHYATLFLLAGIVPGTNIAIGPIDMLAAIATAITIVVLRITVWPLVRSLLSRHITVASPAVKRTTHRII
jgi:hypothetical protein